MAIEIVDFMSRCPIFVIYIIIQLVILIVDFIEMNFVKAFVHFWLGFMFFMSYKGKLCSNNDINLGINQALMVLSFIFFQWFLINWAFSINDMNTQRIIIKEKEEEEVKVEKAKRERNFVKKQLGLEEESEEEEDDDEIIIDADISKNTDEIRVLNIERYGLSRGQKIYLPDGQVRTIIGFKEEFIESYNNSNIKYTVIIVDKSFNKDYSSFFIKKDEDGKLALKKMFNSNNKSIESISLEVSQFQKKKDEIHDNIKLLEEEISKIKLKKPNIENFQTLNEYHKVLKPLERDLNEQKKNLNFVERYLENLIKIKDKIIGKNKSVQNDMKTKTSGSTYKSAKVSSNIKSGSSVSNVATFRKLQNPQEIEDWKARTRQRRINQARGKSPVPQEIQNSFAKGRAERAQLNQQINKSPVPQEIQNSFAKGRTERRSQVSNLILPNSINKKNTNIMTAKEANIVPGQMNYRTARKVDCVGEWSKCNKKCFKTYKVKIPAKNGGKNCENLDGGHTTRGCSPGVDQCPKPNPKVLYKEHKNKHPKNQKVGNKWHAGGFGNVCLYPKTLEDAKSHCNASNDCGGFWRYTSKKYAPRTCFKKNISDSSWVTKSSKPMTGNWAGTYYEKEKTQETLLSKPKNYSDFMGANVTLNKCSDWRNAKTNSGAPWSGGTKDTWKNLFAAACLKGLKQEKCPTQYHQRIACESIKNLENTKTTPIPTHNLKINDKVVAKYPAYRGRADNPWFAAKVTSILNSKINVKYYDGDYGFKLSTSEVYFAPGVSSDVGKGKKRINDIKSLKSKLGLKLTKVIIGSKGDEVLPENWERGTFWGSITGNLNFFRNYTPQQCLDTCNKNKDCFGSSYGMARGTCYHRYGDANIGSKASKVWLASKKTPPPYKIGFGKNLWTKSRVFWGKKKHQDFRNITAADCLNKCNKHRDCTGATFRPGKLASNGKTITQSTCFLRKGDGASISKTGARSTDLAYKRHVQLKCRGHTGIWPSSRYNPNFSMNKRCSKYDKKTCLNQKPPYAWLKHNSLKNKNICEYANSETNIERNDKWNMPKKETKDYIKVTGSGCESLGYSNIPTKKECDKAMSEITGLTQKNIGHSSSFVSSYPRGCFWYKYKNLKQGPKFYPNGKTTNKCNGTWSPYCLCKKYFEGKMHHAFKGVTLNKKIGSSRGVLTEKIKIPKFKTQKVTLSYNYKVRDQGHGNPTYGQIILKNITTGKEHVLSNNNGRGTKVLSGSTRIEKFINSGDTIQLKFYTTRWTWGHYMHWFYVKNLTLNFY